MSEADALAAYEAKQWTRCAELYGVLAAQTTGRQQEDAAYNGACCHARAGDPDRAFALLDRAVAAGLEDVGHVQQDEDLESLRADSRWAPMIAKIEHNVNAWEAKLGDPALHRELLDLMAEDQKARKAIINLTEKPTQEQIDALAAVDRKTTVRMKEIIAAKGWPGITLVGADGANAAWLLVQHADADVAFQKQCLALLEKAVAAGDADAQFVLPLPRSARSGSAPSSARMASRNRSRTSPMSTRAARPSASARWPRTASRCARDTARRRSNATSASSAWSRPRRGCRSPSPRRPTGSYRDRYRARSCRSAARCASSTAR